MKSTNILWLVNRYYLENVNIGIKSLLMIYYNVCIPISYPINDFFYKALLLLELILQHSGSNFCIRICEQLLFILLVPGNRDSASFEKGFPCE